ncbi:hypothetical protein ACFO5Z_11220 [Salipiger abyssi]
MLEKISSLISVLYFCPKNRRCKEPVRKQGKFRADGILPAGLSTALVDGKFLDLVGPALQPEQENHGFVTI